MRDHDIPATRQSFEQADVLAWAGPVRAPRFDQWEPDLTFNLPVDYLVCVDPAEGQFATVQGAVDQAIRDAEHTQSWHRRSIVLRPGFYAGPVYIPTEAPPLTVTGTGAGNCVLSARIDAQMTGREYHDRFAATFSHAPPPVRAHFERIIGREVITTGNTSVLQIARDDTTIANLRVENTYSCDRTAASPPGEAPDLEGRYAQGQHQAVALHVAGADRVALHALQLSSYQDTLYLQAPSSFEMSRISLSDCRIEGDVDFIFGGATAFFTGCEIRSLLDRVARSWAMAPSTNIRARYGFVFRNCRFTHNADHEHPAAAVFLARQWFEGARATPYGVSNLEGYRCEFGPISHFANPLGTINRRALEAVGKCAIFASEVGTHIDRQRPWDGWNTPPWGPRYRPFQRNPRDFLGSLQSWLAENDLCYDDLDLEEIWLHLD